MRWVKRGLIYAPDGSKPWAAHSALQPTPLDMGDSIRVFLGFRDGGGRSSIGFVDVDAENPSLVLDVSESPALERGAPGAFDQDGVVPTAVVWKDDVLRLYYAGYEQRPDVRFRVFGGLATSTDMGETFERYSDEPVMGQSEEGKLFRVPHSVLEEDGRFRVWYGAGGSFIQGDSKTLPVYDVFHLESVDGVSFDGRGSLCIPRKADEYRIGRPYVLKDDKFKMFYGVGTEERGYRLGYAESLDGVNWTRKDEDVGIDVSTRGWDSSMIAYPAIVTNASVSKTFLFYNGNDYGREGFGYAELLSGGGLGP